MNGVGYFPVGNRNMMGQDLFYSEIYHNNSLGKQNQTIPLHRIKLRDFTLKTQIWKVASNVFQPSFKQF